MTEDEIDKLVDDKRRELHKALQPMFGDAASAATELFIAALRREFGSPVKEDDKPRFLDKLAALPLGSTAKQPVWSINSSEEQWRVSFVQDSAVYHIGNRFGTRDEADKYTTKFLMRFREAVQSGPQDH